MTPDEYRTIRINAIGIGIGLGSDDFDNALKFAALDWQTCTTDQAINAAQEYVNAYQSFGQYPTRKAGAPRGNTNRAVPDPRNFTVQFRVNAEELTLLEQGAGGESIGTWVRDVALKAASRQLFGRFGNLRQTDSSRQGTVCSKTKKQITMSFYINEHTGGLLETADDPPAGYISVQYPTNPETLRTRAVRKNSDLIGKRVNVLDKGWIELLDMMPHPATGVSGDLAIVNAARVSFMGESKGEEKDKKLLQYLIKHRHTSPFEQVSFKFRIHAPVVTFWHLVRHRTFSFNFSSGRYVEFEEDQFYVPTTWRKQSPSNKQASLGQLDETESAVLSARLINYYDQGYELYENALEMGVAREQARLFLPAWGSYYTCIASVDAHNLMHFLGLRLTDEAQYEIRVYAAAIYEHFFKPALPWTAEAWEELQK